ncbi:ATP-binding protein [Candidatus Peregrinibacteria bacterium]|nr:ATP-binding protein [Candidatus Peregrinibacteria bacterium]
MSYYIIIRGPLGSGKTTISKKLSNILNAEHIAIDDIIDEYNLANDKEDDYISQKSFIEANEIAIGKAKEILESGKPVIFDGNFYWESQIDDLLSRLDFPHYIFTLKATLELCIERDSKREIPHGQIAAEVVYNKTTEFDRGTLIDTTGSIEDSIGKMMIQIQTDHRRII